jgi:cell division protein ZipA
MTSYILLALLITIIAIGIVRASKQPKVNRRKKTKHESAALSRQPHIKATRTSIHIPPPAMQNPAPSNRLAYDDLYHDDVEEEEDEDEGDQYEYEDILEEEPEESEEDTQEEVFDAPSAEPLKNEVITITLRAEDNKSYKGYELLQALLTCGMRYSRQGVFHRYTKLIKRDQVLFSLISAVAPGTFDLPKLGSFSSPALTLFMQTGEVENAAETYDLMLGTARDLVEALGGYLLDEHKTPLTAEKISYWQHKLKRAVVA